MPETERGSAIAVLRREVRAGTLVYQGPEYRRRMVEILRTLPAGRAVSPESLDERIAALEAEVGELKGQKAFERRIRGEVV